MKNTRKTEPQDDLSQRQVALARWSAGLNGAGALVCFAWIGSAVPTFWGGDCPSAFGSADAILAAIYVAKIFLFSAGLAVISMVGGSMVQIPAPSKPSPSRNGKTTGRFRAFRKRASQLSPIIFLVIITASTVSAFIWTTYASIKTIDKIYNYKNLGDYRSHIMEKYCTSDPLAHQS